MLARRLSDLLEIEVECGWRTRSKVNDSMHWGSGRPSFQPQLRCIFTILGKIFHCFESDFQSTGRKGKEFSTSWKSYFKLDFLKAACIKQRIMKDSERVGLVMSRIEKQNQQTICFAPPESRLCSSLRLHQCIKQTRLPTVIEFTFHWKMETIK